MDLIPEYDNDDWANDPWNNGDIPDPDLQGPWDYDEFGPDADVWHSISE